MVPAYTLRAGTPHGHGEGVDLVVARRFKAARRHLRPNSTRRPHGVGVNAVKPSPRLAPRTDPEGPAPGSATICNMDYGLALPNFLEGSSAEGIEAAAEAAERLGFSTCLLYTSPSPRD